MYSIGQVAEFLGISRDQLRYYEKKQVFQPSQNQENLYREYTEEDIDKILAIDFYRSLDLDFKTISLIREQNNLTELAETLTAKQRSLETEINRLKNTQQRVDEVQKTISKIKKHLNQYSIRAFPKQIVLGRFSDFRAYEEFSVIHQVKGEGSPVTHLKRLLTFNQQGVTHSEMLITSSLEAGERTRQEEEQLTFDSCVYTIVEDRQGEEGMMAQLFTKTQQHMEENNLTPIGKVIICMLLLSIEGEAAKSYLEIYVPFDS